MGSEQRAPGGFSDLSMEQVRQRIANFADERDWQQYHTPRNLLLALVGEVGELSEIFQWRGEVTPGLPGFTEHEREHLGEELADVLLYLVRLSDRCGVDLSAAVLDKLKKNAAKYPAQQCKGRSDKYSAYANDDGSAGAGAEEQDAGLAAAHRAEASREEDAHGDGGGSTKSQSRPGE